MVLFIINALMASALLFAFYITQDDRDYWCQRQMNKVWSKVWKS